MYIVSTGNVNIHHATYCLGTVSVVEHDALLKSCVGPPVMAKSAVKFRL